jgi:hypothetical protein
MSIAFQNTSSAAARALVERIVASAEVGQRARNTVVTPSGVLFCHLNNQRLDNGIDARSSPMGTLLGTVELASNQATIPGEDGLRFSDTGYPLQRFPPEVLANHSERAAVRVGEAGLSREVGVPKPSLSYSGENGF